MNGLATFSTQTNWRIPKQQLARLTVGFFVSLLSVSVHGQLGYYSLYRSRIKMGVGV
jgi:hypothetical protein